MRVQKSINTGKYSLDILETSKIHNKVDSGRVDINNLLARVRKEKDKENKTNLVFFSLFVSLVLIVGIILTF
tara:strand:- start:443 stop:658 length:216 start_codon:yes stop_codon:yes gene_type:complete